MCGFGFVVLETEIRWRIEFLVEHFPVLPPFIPVGHSSEVEAPSNPGAR